MLSTVQLRIYFLLASPRQVLDFNNVVLRPDLWTTDLHGCIQYIINT